jgi:hypothetical protein
VSPSPTSSMKRAATAAALGLLVQLGASFYWTPLTFIVSAIVGLPLVCLGAFLFLRTVFRIVKSKGAF